jgi:hypothetical protein
VESVTVTVPFSSAVRSISSAMLLRNPSASSTTLSKPAPDRQRLTAIAMSSFERFATVTSLKEAFETRESDISSLGGESVTGGRKMHRNGG